MTATELYRQLHHELGAWFAEHGFKRRRIRPLAYQRRRGEPFQTVWFQCDRYGWDTYAGSSFFVNFSVTADPDPESVTARSERINLFLTNEELEIARAWRNAIVARIPPPPTAYFEMMEAAARKSLDDPEMVMNGLRMRFEPERLPYRRNHDLALRYFAPQDVAGWANFIQAVLPRAIAAMDTWVPHRR
jgi:hypothetical protein